MTVRKKVKAEVLNNTRLADRIYSLSLRTGLAAEIRPGQFIGIYTGDNAALLPRPISICDSEPGDSVIRLVYRVVGKGTAELSGLKPADTVNILGILGNGYDITTAYDKRDIILMAGGIGIPPILGLAKALVGDASVTGRVSAVLGYRDSALFLRDDIEKYCDVYIATDDGSIGCKGTVIDAVTQYKLTPDIIYACGPMPMLRGIKTLGDKMDIPAYISLEERMACGVGACLGCVVRTAHRDSHSNVNNARICTDGPVFEASEVDI